MYQNGRRSILLVVSTRHGENEMTTSTTRVTGTSGVAR
jgi:hypothetical protein